MNYSDTEIETNHLKEEEIEEIEIVHEDEIDKEYEIGDSPPTDDYEHDSDSMVDYDSMDEHSENRIKQDDSIYKFQEHKKPVYTLSIHPNDPSIIVSGGGDDRALLWKINYNQNNIESRILHEFGGHTDSVVMVQFSCDGKLVATAGYDGIVNIWSVENGTFIRTLEGPTEEIEWIAWHNKAAVLLAGSSDGTTWMWLVSVGNCMKVFAGHEASVTCGSFTGSGKLVVTGSADHTVRIWNPRTGLCLHTFRGDGFHEAPICTITCHPTQPLILSTSHDGTARLLHVQQQKTLAIFHHGTNSTTETSTDRQQNEITNSVECAAFALNNNWCATGCLGGELRIWDLSTYHCRHVCKHEDGITKLAWHPTENYVITCCLDAKVRIWDARNGNLLKNFVGHDDIILDMGITIYSKEKNNISILTCGDDETVRNFLF